MRPNAWQRSCVGKACHKKKKAHGAERWGEEKKGGGAAVGEGGGGGRGGVCFSSGATVQSEVDVEKPGNGKTVPGGFRSSCGSQSSPLAARRHRASAPSGRASVWLGKCGAAQDNDTLCRPRVSFSKHFQNADANQTTARRQVSRPAQVKLTSLLHSSHFC